MQMYTPEDVDFAQILSAWQQCTLLGKYSTKKHEAYVGVSNQYVMIACGPNPSRIAMRPARSLEEAQGIAMRVLDRETKRGNLVEIIKPVAS